MQPGSNNFSEYVWNCQHMFPNAWVIIIIIIFICTHRYTSSSQSKHDGER